MTWLEIIIIITGVMFIIFSFDLFQRKKFTLLHFLVFAGGTVAIILFSRFPGSLDTFGRFFGVARGADLLVYLIVIFLAYGYISLINRYTKHSSELTKLISNQAIQAHKSIPKSGRGSIGFLIRAYNEEGTIKEVLESILSAGYKYIIICNDGSSDGTGGAIDTVVDAYSGKATIISLHHSLNRGAGAANKTLFSFARQYGATVGIDRRVTFDADGQMDIQDMKAFEAKMLDSVDTILGSRHISGGSMEGVPVIRKVILQLSKIFTYITTGRYFSDPHNGYRVIRSELLEKVTILSDSMAYASELLDELIRLDASIVEVPVSITYTPESLSKGQKDSNSLKIVGELIYTWWFYK